jgi:hypothetical protein
MRLTEYVYSPEVYSKFDSLVRAQRSKFGDRDTFFDVCHHVLDVENRDHYCGNSKNHCENEYNNRRPVVLSDDALDNGKSSDDTNDSTASEKGSVVKVNDSHGEEDQSAGASSE